jgi:hypothetical protein
MNAILSSMRLIIDKSENFRLYVRFMDHRLKELSMLSICEMLPFQEAIFQYDELEGRVPVDMWSAYSLIFLDHQKSLPMAENPIPRPNSFLHEGWAVKEAAERYMHAVSYVYRNYAGNARLAPFYSRKDLLAMIERHAAVNSSFFRLFEGTRGEIDDIHRVTISTGNYVPNAYFEGLYAIAERFIRQLGEPHFGFTPGVKYDRFPVTLANDRYSERFRAREGKEVREVVVTFEESQQRLRDQEWRQLFSNTLFDEAGGGGEVIHLSYPFPFEQKMFTNDDAYVLDRITWPIVYSSKSPEMYQTVGKVIDWCKERQLYDNVELNQLAMVDKPRWHMIGDYIIQMDAVPLMSYFLVRPSVFDRRMRDVLDLSDHSEGAFAWVPVR